jgi:predicted GNAT superfamily acetyltransferase
MIRPHEPDDLPAMLALNNAFATETSHLTEAALRHLIAVAFRVRIAGQTDALCLALDQTAAYDSPNFLWFQGKFGRFVYVDRVIVAAHARGLGLARALYADLVTAARQAGHARLCCEVNVYPANPASDRFHQAFGFVEAGRAVLADRGKTVRYLTLAL